MNSERKETRPVAENKMGVDSVGRLLASMAIPMMISMLVQAFYNVVDSVFVAKVSQNALNAVSLSFPLQNLLIAFGAGTAMGMNSLLSRALGAKEQKKADRIANTGVLLAFFSAVLFALVGLFLTKPFFEFQTKMSSESVNPADIGEIVSFGASYSTICLICSFGIFFQFCFERLLQSTGKTGLAMCTQLLGAIINIILDPILIFGLLGMPKMGVAGAAVATVTGQIIAAIAALILNIKCNKEIHLSFKMIRWHGKTVKDIYKIGLPSIVMQSIGSVMTFGLNRILIGFSDTATAVFGAYFKLQSFIFMPIFGLNNGMIPIIAYNFGAKKPERVKRTIVLSIVSAVTIMTCGCILFEVAPEWLLSLFTPSEEMLTIGETALRMIAVHFIMAGFCIIAGSVCQAIGNPVFSLIVSVCRQLVVLLPAAWLLAQSGRLALVWLAFPIAECVSLLLSSIFLRLTMKSANKKMAQPLVADE